jgi:hypothetical protein
MSRRRRLTSRRARRWAALALPIVLLAAAAAHADDVATLKAEARAASDRGDLPTAVQKLRAALAQQRTHDVAGNLGLVEARAGLWVPAIEHLQLGLDLFPASGKPEARDALEKRSSTQGRASRS